MANGGYGHSEETKKAMSDDWQQHHSPESMKKCHDANKGRECSEEHRQKLSEANKGNQYCLGHTQSEETIKKRMISMEAKYGSKICGALGCDRTDGYKHKGIRYCNKHVQRLEDYGSLDARPHPKPTLGKKMSEETKIKISESRRGKTVGKNNPFYGKQHNPEIIAYLRKINLGKEPPNKKIFSDKQTGAILNDSRSLRKIAKDFGVSTTVIRRIRREGLRVA